MDATHSTRLTGTMLEVNNVLSPYPLLAPETVPRVGPHRDVQDVPGDGDCLYHSIAGLYNHTIHWPLGYQLQTRMRVVAAQYAPGTTFTPTARYLRMLFLDFLREHWDHYYDNPVFRDDLLQVAKKDLPSAQAGFEPTSASVQRAYIRRMGRVRRIKRLEGGAPYERMEWAGPVECDIASELFGMRITLWMDHPEDRHSYELNSVFVPRLLAGSVDPIMTLWRWELVQTGMAHFKYFTPWVADLDPISQAGESVMDAPALSQARAHAGRRVRWADRVNQYQEGAIEKIRALIARGVHYSWDEFKQWFSVNFTIPGVAARLGALHLFFAAYTYLFQEAEEAAGAPSQLPPFTPFLQGPSMGRSVVDEVFAKHARFAP